MMLRRISAFITLFALIISISNVASACDEKQSNTYISQILFGDSAARLETHKTTKLLFSAMYICSEQSDGLGQEKLTSLETAKIGKVPTLADINIKGDSIYECSHSGWEHIYAADRNVQKARHNILIRTVNKCFDFGTFNNWFGADSGKCNSFAAFLYYAHILSDFLADDAAGASIVIRGKKVPAYSGKSSIEINGNKPSFSASQKQNTLSFSSFSPLDSLGRSGSAFANIGIDDLAAPDSRQYIGTIQPSGWKQNRYPGLVNSEPPYLFNRCHLIAHQLLGNDKKENLITGTRYLNTPVMTEYETKVVKYIRETGNHVLYRATPIYAGRNLLATGVQLEAYSVEDNGKGVCFNVFCYNVQPGVDIIYSNGENERSLNACEDGNVIPFALYNANDNKSDLIYEMKKHLEILFADKKSLNTYQAMMSKIDELAIEARNIDAGGKKEDEKLRKTKELEYEFFENLKNYVPLLLQKESFFTSAFPTY